MNNFNVAVPTRIVFGEGTIKELTTLVPKDKIVIFISGGGSIKANGVYDQCMKALDGFDIREFSGIEANPDFDTCMKCVAMIREIGGDKVFLLSVGGGSVLDGTKFISAAVSYDHSEDPWEILTTGGRFVGKCIPLACVLTLPATGSEMNEGTVVSRRKMNCKYSFANFQVFPVFSILDPTTTYSLPVKQTANGVCDAMVHVLEQYATTCIGADVQDRAAEGLLLTLIDNGRVVMQNPNDYTARANIMWAATNALNRFIGVGVVHDWSTHRIGHELTAYLGLDHGQTLAIIQPRVMRFNFETKKAKLAQFGRRVFNITHGTEEDIAKEAICQLERYYEDVLKLPTHISKLNCSQDKAWIDKVVEKFTQNQTKLGELGNITPEDAKQIILDSY